MTADVSLVEAGTWQLLRYLNATEEAELPLCPEEPKPPVPWTNYLLIVILAICSGMFSGLNLGLLGLDVKNLELLT